MIDHEDLDRRTRPQDCQTMAHVRDGVDRLDRALVQLIAERARYMEAAARIKPTRETVRDEAMIERWKEESEKYDVKNYVNSVFSVYEKVMN